MRQDTDTTRREILRKGLFVAPAILTLVAAPSFASAGSGKDPNAQGHDE
jgi:hypothetical protein